MGGKIRFFVSGSAALNREVQEWFYAAGLLVLEGYGLTETSAATCVNNPAADPVRHRRPADAGHRGQDRRGRRDPDQGSRRDAGLPQPARGVSRSPCVDGWFATGDIGELDDHGYLRITDRKKDLIKTSGGKYVAPQKVEGVVKAACPYISQVVVHGDGRKYVTALITLDPEAIEGWAS